jgi:hypothetical protein
MFSLRICINLGYSHQKQRNGFAEAKPSNSATSAKPFLLLSWDFAGVAEQRKEKAIN